MQQKTSKISGAAVISFFTSAVLCSIIIGIMIIYSPHYQPWYSYPINIALIAAGIIICFLVSCIVQCKFELKHIKVHFNDMAITDPLTNTYNRRYVDENIDRLVKSVTRSNSVLAVMMADLDFFKNYNEAYGHNKGDKCLISIANIISQNLKRDNDFVARYGSEEFVIVMPNTDETGARMIADRLLEKVRDSQIPHEKSDISNRVTISIGITTGGRNYSCTGDDFINKANEALKKSKESGRNRYTVINLE